MWAILNPIKLIIENYPDDKQEVLNVPYNVENEGLGSREITFSKELYIDAEDFMINPPNKYYRLFVGNEVRLMNAYFIKATRYDVESNGNVTTVYATYDENIKKMEDKLIEKLKVQSTSLMLRIANLPQ